VDDVVFCGLCISATPSLSGCIVTKGGSLTQVWRFSGGIDMTIVQDDAGGERMPMLPLAPRERPALVAILSAAKRNALIACFNAGGLHKKDGAWHGLPNTKPSFGVTVADLARDGMLTLNAARGFGSARLTERGNWFARTLLDGAVGK
jgi:hypothetical protein